MRGVISAGMVAALEELGLLEVFDVVYGASAGAINAVYFLSGEASSASRMYAEVAESDSIVRLRRCFSGNPMLSLDQLFEHIATSDHRLDWRSLLQHPVPLRVVVSSVAHMRSTCLRDFASVIEMQQALRATASVPGISGDPIRFRDDAYLDAHLFEPIPFRAAVSEGCSHVLVLRTRPRGVRLSRVSAFDTIVAWRLRRFRRELGTAALVRHQVYDSDCAYLEAANDQRLTDEPHIMSVFPTQGARPIRVLEKDAGLLASGLLDGFTALRASLGPAVASA